MRDFDIANLMTNVGSLMWSIQRTLTPDGKLIMLLMRLLVKIQVCYGFRAKVRLLMAKCFVRCSFVIETNGPHNHDLK